MPSNIFPTPAKETSIDPIIKLPKVCELTGLSKSSIYEKMSNDEFPKSIAISTRSVGWLLSEVNTFIQSKVVESRKEDTA
jgi:prophage regulatory protein